MATSGFLAQLGSDVREKGKQRHQEQHEADVQLRERRADEIAGAIKNMTARAALRPNDAGYMNPEELKKNLAAAQQELTGLYKPEEGHKLLQKLREATSGAVHRITGTPQPGGKQPLTLRPGMTLNDVLRPADLYQSRRQRRQSALLTVARTGNTSSSRKMTEVA